MFLKAAAGQAKSPFRIKPSCALRFKLARQKKHFGIVVVPLLLFRSNSEFFVED